MNFVRHICTRLLLPAALLTTACNDTTTSGAAGTACQKPGTATAALLDTEGTHFTGHHAIGGAGDWLIQNDHAGYIIQGVDRGISYYHYGGILVDAVAMDGCTQASPEHFEEMGLLVGSLNLDEVYNTTLRAFRATSIEVINDGRDGEAAIIRATGHDDHYWLVEYTLVNLAFNEDDPKKLSSRQGIAIQVDYILRPDSPVLEAQITLINEVEDKQEFTIAGEILFGDRTELTRYAESDVEAGGFSFAIGIPFLTAATPNREGAYAFSIADANIGAAHISGVDAVFDFEQVLSDPLELSGVGDSESISFLFSAGRTDGHSAAAPLAVFADRFQDQHQFRLEPFTATIVDASSSQPVSGAHVRLQVEDTIGWFDIDTYVSGPDGTIAPDRMVFDNQEFNYRLVAGTDAGGDADPVGLKAGQPSATIKVPTGGTLQLDVKDGDGVTLPYKLSLYQDDERTHKIFLGGKDSVAIPAGTYDISLTRGFEYTTYQGTITIKSGETTNLSATLERVVDTTGFLSIDTHVHSDPSPDSRVSLAERIRNSAAEGLEIPVATDHEHIVGLQAGIDETGLHDWVGTIPGEEVTAVLPEHLTMFPSPPLDEPRGGIVVWYQLGLPELWTAMHERTNDGVNILNHPSILETMKWDIIAGAPGIDNYEDLQMTKSEKPWSWDFEGIEYMNGTRVPFLEPGDDPSSSRFNNWMSFLNHGHHIIGVGCSDAHGTEDLGSPRSYYRSPTDKPGEMTEADAVKAFKDGNVVVSAGAFARISAINNVAVELGETITDTDGVIDLKLDVSAIPEIDVRRIRVYSNCDEIMKFATQSTDTVTKYNGTISVPVTAMATGQDAHIVIAGFGDNPMPRGLHSFNAKNVPRFTTNPIFIDVDGNGNYDAPGGKTCEYTLD